MESVRSEILPGVWLTALKTDKFKTDCLSMTLLTQLTRENAAKNAVLPFVLRRGTELYPDMQSIAAELDSLYGAYVEPVVRRIGEIQCVGFLASFPDDKYLPQGEDVFARTAGLMGEMLLHPNTSGGLLRVEYVESEKEKLLELIRSRVNEKRSYSIQRLIEEMCCYEDFAVTRFGTEDTAESIYYRSLTKHYRTLLSSSPVEVFYCGSKDAKAVSEAISDALCGMPRGEIDYNIGTDIRMNSVEEDARYFEEELSVTQGKLVMGYRLGDCMDDPDIAAIYVFNAVFGGSVTSKLFMNVREKLSLCYFAGSFADAHKGLLTVYSGIDFDKFDEAKAEILAQLDDIRHGNVTEEELRNAKTAVITALSMIPDSAGELEGFWLANTVDGIELEPEELASLCEYVSLDDVVSIANSVVLDAVYFLQGNGEDGNDEA